MLNIVIELNVEDKAFDVKWVMNKESILEVGKDYCPCCYYRLNSKKNKVIELMDVLFKEETIKIPPHEKSIRYSMADFYSLLQVGSLDFNIVVSKEIVHERIPLKGIVLKEKHVIVEELSDEDLDSKNKELVDEIRKAFSDKSQDQESCEDESKEDLNSDDPVDEIKKMFEIMTTKVKLTKEDLFKADGSRRPVDEVYEIVQIKKKNDDVKKSLFDSFKELNETSTKEELNIRNNVLDDMLEEVFDILFKKEFSNKDTSSNNKESLEKVFEYGRNKFTGDEEIAKPIRDVEDGGCSKLATTTLESVRKTATYDMSKNGKPMYSITLNKTIYLFNNIEIYYLGHGDTFRKYYLNLDSNGIPSSNISIKDLESILLNNQFSNVIDFNQQRYLFDTEVKMPGLYKVIPDIVLLMGDNVPTNFPSPEKLIKDVKVTNFYNLVNPVVFTNLTFKRGMENRTEFLTKETPYITLFKESNYDRFRRENLIRPVYRRVVYVDFKDDNILFSNYKIENVTGYYVVNPITSNANRELNDFLTDEYKGRVDNIFFMTLGATLHFSKEYNNPDLVFELVKDGNTTEDKTNEPVDSNTKKDNENNEILYLRVYQNKLGATLLPQTNKILYRISDNNSTSSIKKLSTWIRSMHGKAKDKKYSYKDILITTSALKKLRQEEIFGEMNFEEVDK